MHIYILIFQLFIFSFYSFITKDFIKYNQDLPLTSLDITMIPINGGSLHIDDNFSESSFSKYEVSSFWMSQYEISWDLYTLFMERSIDSSSISFVKGYEVFRDIDGISSATTPYIEMSFGMGVEGYPAINMTQFAASKFCEWLSALTGNYYRLPTEAEWEYACRAGSKSSFHFGDDISLLDDYAWYSENSRDTYHKIGTKKPNQFDLYDMHGNVSEWTIDTYSENIYPDSKNNKDPFYIINTKYPKTIKGGSWNDEYEKLKNYSRYYSSKKLQIRDPQIPKSKWWNTDAPFIGFRIVRPFNTPEDDIKNLFWNY